MLLLENIIELKTPLTSSMQFVKFTQQLKPTRQHYKNIFKAALRGPCGVLLDIRIFYSNAVWS